MELYLYCMWILSMKLLNWSCKIEVANEGKGMWIERRKIYEDGFCHVKRGGKSLSRRRSPIPISTQENKRGSLGNVFTHSYSKQWCDHLVHSNPGRVTAAKKRDFIARRWENTKEKRYLLFSPSIVREKRTYIEPMFTSRKMQKLTHQRSSWMHAANSTGKLRHWTLRVP